MLYYSALMRRDEMAVSQRGRRDTENDQTESNDRSSEDEDRDAAAVNSQDQHIIDSVRELYKKRIRQLEQYADSGKYLPFEVKELRAKIAQVNKEREEWERDIAARRRKSTAR
jgi:hypothetical protein